MIKSNNKKDKRKWWAVFVGVAWARLGWIGNTFFGHDWV
jgi:hypothetical protein